MTRTTTDTTVCTPRERFRVTYDTVTDDSAEHGDVADAGYASPGAWRHDDPADLTLRDAIHAAGRMRGRGGAGAGFENAGRAWYTIDADVDYRTGEHTRYAIHPPRGITPASYARVTRVLCGDRRRRQDGAR